MGSERKGKLAEALAALGNKPAVLAEAGPFFFPMGEGRCHGCNRLQADWHSLTCPSIIIPLLVAAVEEAGRVRPAVVAMLDEILALDGIEQPGPGENVAGVVNDALEHLRDRERRAIARAEAAEGDRDSLCEHAAALQKRLWESANDITQADTNELQDILRTLTPSGTALLTSARELVRRYEKSQSALAQSEAEVARLRELAAEAAEFIASDHPGLQDDVGELWAKLHTAWSAARSNGDDDGGE